MKKDGSTGTTQQIIQYNPKTGTHTKQFVQIAPKTSTPIKPSTTKVFKPVITKVKKLSDIAPAAATPEAKKSVIDTPQKMVLETPRNVKAVTEKKVGQQVAANVKAIFEKHRTSLSVSEPPTADEESDDGLEELPFPEEIKVPEPESPQGEFSLDPFTGKLAGVEYPEPVPEPEPSLIEEEKADESSLDNIVKLAAADITEDDLKGDSTEAPMDIEPQPMPEPEEPQEMEEEKPKLKTSPLVIRKTDLNPASIAAVNSRPPIMRVTTVHAPVKRQSPASILNRALTGSPQVIRKTIVSPHSSMQQQRMQQRILNPTIGRTTTVLNPIIRTGNTYSRVKPATPKPKFNIASFTTPTRMVKSPSTPIVTKATYVTKVRKKNYRPCLTSSSS